MVGQIIGGDYGEIWIRKKSDAKLEIGELLRAGDYLLQIFDLEYGSLLEHRDLARMSGMELEGMGETNIKERNIRNYILVKAKPVYNIQRGTIPKSLPEFFGKLRKVHDSDFKFLKKDGGADSIYLGKLRSGSTTLDIPLFLDGKEVLRHHILIPATTGRGKSNLMKVMLWNIVGKDYAGILVLDAHNEYYTYTRDGKKYGLKEHPKAKEHPRGGESVLYYSPNPVEGGISLKINIQNVRPHHLKEITEFTSAQEDAMYLAYREWKSKWIEELLKGSIPKGITNEVTIAVLQRKIQVALELMVTDNKKIVPQGNIFSVGELGKRTIKDIVERLDEGKIVILDTSTMSKDLEILIASMIMSEIFERHKRCKEGRDEKCKFDELPVVSVVLEEAPRVLGGEGSNIFKTIAREGRKFNVGMIAITQLPSMIPREIMANLNTKLILGNETKSERDAIISSAPQDLSKDSKMIASLDKGEAIVSSIFTKFAIPVKIDLFEDTVERSRKAEPKKVKMAPPPFGGNASDILSY